MFSSSVFQFSIPRRFELTEIMRQLAGEQIFLKALKEIRMGLCSSESFRFFSELFRNLPSSLEATDVIHIFFKKIPAMLFNHRIVENLPGEVLRFNARKDGET